MLEKNCLLTLTTIALGLFGQVDAAPIAVPVVSTFDAGLDGWTGDNPGELSFAAAGGNPGGFLRFDDNSPSGGEAFAPAKFLGDWSALDGIGSISYDQIVISTGSFFSVGSPTIALVGPGGEATWTSPVPAPNSCPGNLFCDWETVDAPLVEGLWSVTSGSWENLLQDVTSFSIWGDLYGSLSVPDAEGLDNVRLGVSVSSVPEPAAITLFGLGLGGLWASRRHRRH